ncbi:hypothetical protein RKD34_001926 [Streptomyces sp. SAI-218]
MRPVGEQTGVEQHLALQAGATAFGERREQPLGGGVARRDGGLDGGQSALGGQPGGQSVEQGGGETAAAVGRVHGHLPDEEGVGPVRADVPGDEPDGLSTVVPCHRRRGGEVATPQQIAVRRVQVEDLGVAGDPPQCGSVRDRRPVDLQVCLCGSHAN